jgi:hypothetical protein
MGEFGFCGVETLHLCPEELILENVIKWKNIGYDVVGQTPEGKEKKTLKVFYHETPLRELISNLKPRLQSFMTHNFVSKWQEHQFKSILGTIPSGSIIYCVDILYNYTMQVQNETQSMNCHNVHINIFVHSTYRLDLTDVPLDRNTLKVIKELH